MKVLMINVVCGIGSTGKICVSIAKDFERKGHDVIIAYGRGVVPGDCQKYAHKIEGSTKLNLIKARVCDNEGLNAKRETKQFLEWSEEYNPDLLWIHNIHGYFINYRLLFNWIKTRPQMKVLWTLHDCWAFTGHCAYFLRARCTQWETRCQRCPQRSEYPRSYFLDRCKENFNIKKKAFNEVSNMTLLVPSEWLADLVKKSFLKNYKIKVIRNSIDTGIFKHCKNNFKDNNGIKDKIMLLGVANVWEKRKGLKDLIWISRRLDERFVIVIVGLQKKQAIYLPKNIISMGRVESAVELARIYSAADIYLNPSREETFGMTTLEALSCGTSVIVYKDTACEEVIKAYGRGVAVEMGAENMLLEIVKRYP